MNKQMPEKKEPKGHKKKGKNAVREDTKNKAHLKKEHYPLPGEKDIQYNYQPEFLDTSGNKQGKDTA